MSFQLTKACSQITHRISRKADVEEAIKTYRLLLRDRNCSSRPWLLRENAPDLIEPFVPFGPLRCSREVAGLSAEVLGGRWDLQNGKEHTFKKQKRRQIDDKRDGQKLVRERETRRQSPYNKKACLERTKHLMSTPCCCYQCYLSSLKQPDEEA